MNERVVILGAGFGGLALSTMLSQALGNEIDVTLIDKNDAFVFGFSKLDVMFGRTTPDQVRLAYREIAQPGVRVLKETITAIDPEARRVTTDAGVHEADMLGVRGAPFKCPRHRANARCSCTTNLPHAESARTARSHSSFRCPARYRPHPKPPPPWRASSRSATSL